MDRLTRWSMPLVRVGGLFLAMKGAAAEQEVDSATREIRRLGGADQRVVTVGAQWLGTPVTVVQVQKTGTTGRSRQSGKRPGGGR
jgi:16S rRNA (guanine527-N7)-methyltransferase